MVAQGARAPTATAFSAVTMATLCALATPPAFHGAVLTSRPGGQLGGRALRLHSGPRLRGGRSESDGDEPVRGPEVPVEVGADITGDGGVLKTILETGWRSPMFSDGDEVRCAEMFRSFNPVPHTTGASIWRHI
jgi:hypothetical protein